MIFHLTLLLVQLPLPCLKSLVLILVQEGVAVKYLERVTWFHWQGLKLLLNTNILCHSLESVISCLSRTRLLPGPPADLQNLITGQPETQATQMTP